MITFLVLFLTFIATRLFIWFFPPEFTDVMYSYYHYARIWSEGYTPYLVHLFEYPPANIILFYVPWFIDHATLIVDYPTTYRFMIFLVDLVIFILAYKTLKKLNLKKSIVIISLIYYIAALTKAKDFVYDSMDLVFISTFFISLSLLKLKKQTAKTRFFSWVFFWLSTALKYITAPLVLPFLLLHKGKNFWREVKMACLGFITVWAIPLVLFRSSLSVSFVYHFKRGFQVESMPANIIRLVNRWTKSDAFVEVYKNYDIIGPVTAKLTPYLSFLFMAAMLGFLIYSTVTSLKFSKRLKDEFFVKLNLSLIYLLLFLMTAKVFSTPFNLWLPPLLTIYPYKSIKKQLAILLTSFFVIVIGMTPIPNLKFAEFELHNMIGLAKPICFGFICWQLIKEVQNAKIT